MVARLFHLGPFVGHGKSNSEMAEWWHGVEAEVVRQLFREPNGESDSEMFDRAPTELTSMVLRARGRTLVAK